MANDSLALLVRLTLAASVAVVLIGVLRAPARRVVGPEAAFWLWLLVPACLIGALLPPLALSAAAAPVVAVPSPIRRLELPAHLPPAIAKSESAPLAMLVWLAGIAVAFVYFAHRQQALRRSLGVLHPGPEGTYWSKNARQPMLIGAWRSKIVLPGDFETRYSASECTLILAHERVHLDRQDALTNGIAVLLACLFWFNPLMHWGRNRFRFDQEVACDAAVLRQLKVSRRHYARALAKSELTMAAAIGFGWSRRHPLIERIAILKLARPTRARRLLGYFGALTLMLSGTYLAWAAQPDRQVPTSGADHLIVIDVRWFIDGAEVLTVGHGSGAPDIMMQPGVAFSLVARPFSSSVQYVLKCIPSLDSSSSVSAVRGTSADLLMKCEISRQGRVLSTPTVDFHSGQSATIRTMDTERNAALRIELGASDNANPPKMTINFHDADIGQVAAAVQLATHKTVEIDPRVHARLTMYSRTPWTAEQFYQAFLVTLQDQGLVTVEAKDFIRIELSRDAG